MFEHQLRCRCTGVSERSSLGLPRESQFFLTESKPHFAPDRKVDFKHLKLEIDVDLKAKILKGSCTHQFEVVAEEVGELIFDAIDLVIHKVSVSGKSVLFDQDDKKVQIFLKRKLRRGDKSSVTLTYSVREPRAGLYFIAPTKHELSRPWQLWTQGQDQDNRYWIPCHDSPNQKTSTEMVVTVDSSYKAISNGRLVSEKLSKDKKKRTFHWDQKIPHSSYLITLCVGDFVVLKDFWTNSQKNKIPVDYYTLKGREKETKLAFGKTPKMIDFFSKKIGVEYPYEKYAQIVAWDFIYGGMENTSATTQTEYTLHPESVELDYSSEYLVAHELAHQWFGDLLTCKEWSHAWLNEGFATYFESLWTKFEHGTDEAQYERFGFEKSYKLEDSGSYRRPVVTNVFLSPSDIFDRHLYEKGARILHMLRKMVGDKNWWKAIRLYVTTHRENTVETVDLQRAFEKVTGLSLSWFFDQWVFKGGHPHLEVKYSWDEKKKKASFEFNQKQKESDLTPIFKFPLKVKFGFGKKEIEKEIFISHQVESISFDFNQKPKWISVNRENEILMNLEFNPGVELLKNQIQFDKDCMGRIHAIKTLSKNSTKDTLDFFNEVLKKEKFWGVQLELLDVLSKFNDEKTIEILQKHYSKIKHPKARKSVIRSLSQFRDEDLFSFFKMVSKKDESPLVQYEVGMAIGKLKTKEAFEFLKKELNQKNDQQIGP